MNKKNYIDIYYFILPNIMLLCVILTWLQNSLAIVDFEFTRLIFPACQESTPSKFKPMLLWQNSGVVSVIRSLIKQNATV